MAQAMFYVDEGGVYELSLDGDGNVVMAEGLRTRVAYTSEAHSLKITGKHRRQKVGAGYYVLGNRAVFTLDTGEGLSELHGVYYYTG